MLHLTPWPPLLKERGKRGMGVKGERCKKYFKKLAYCITF